MQSFDECLFAEIVEAEFDSLLNRALTMSRAKHWCFTLNNYTENDVNRLSDSPHFEYIVFGREVGASGTPHLQGFVSFPSRVRRSVCVEKIGQAHFTVARNIENSIEYCKKDGDFLEFGVRTPTQGSRNDLTSFKEAVALGCTDMKKLREDFSEIVAKYPKFVNDYVEDHSPKPIIKFHPLRDWQQELYAYLVLPADDRTVNFVVDPVGNSGKSWFGHYYSFMHDDSQVLLPGKKADMAYALRRDVRVLFIDAPRSKQGDFIQYDFLEDVKNGYVFSSKYESSVKVLGQVHVVVFMNEQPDQNKLSVDRYLIRNV